MPVPLVAERNPLVLLGIVAASVVAGAAIAVAPMLAVAATGAAAVVVVAFRFPVAHLALLIAVTALVPYDVMNALGGGSGSAGLVISDVLLFSGLARAVGVLGRQRLGRWEVLVVVGVTLLAVAALLQFLHGYRNGAQIGTAGHELRILLGFTTALIALPILRDEQGRRRLFTALLGVSLLLGTVGLAQWVAGSSFVGSGDFGVREGVDLTSEGRGQLQGGLYSYPVAVILSFAALVSLPRGSGLVRWLVLLSLTLNAICDIVTFERTFWVVTVLGCAFVAVRSSQIKRAKVVVGGITAAIVGLAVLAAVAPGTFTTARERLMSIGQYGSDNSVAYRLRESSFVAREIDESPGTGQGLGATVYWGRPAEGVQAEALSYSHNGFLWLAWKIGIPTAFLLFALLLATVAWRPPRDGRPLDTTLVVGCQGALLALFIVNVTFPSVSALSSTPTVGVLLAVCAAAFSRREAQPELAARASGTSAAGVRRLVPTTSR